MRRNATSYLTREEIRALVEPSDLEGALSVFTSWSMIGAAFALLSAFPAQPAAWIVGVVVLGGRQLGLAILMHECSHHSLFRSRALNEWVGTWLCAAPVWQRLEDYRRHHRAHHAHTSQEGDTDLGLVASFPTTRAGLFRKLLRDLLGIAFLRRVLGTLLMDAGVLTYSASTGQRRVHPAPGPRAIARNLLRNTGPTVLTNGLLFACLAAIGHGELYGAWVLANAIPFSLFVRIRSIAEHAVTATTDDPFRNTRTTAAHALARLTVAPHHVNFHLEHHLLPTVPHYRLRAMHQLLRERGAYEDAEQAAGYLEVLRRATDRRGPIPVA